MKEKILKKEWQERKIGDLIIVEGISDEEQVKADFHLIIKVTESTAITLACNNSPHPRWGFFQLEIGNVARKKMTVMLRETKEIEEKNYQEMYGKMKKEELQEVYKALAILMNSRWKHNIRGISLNEMDFIYEEQDIIEYQNSFWYISKIEDNTFYCYNVNLSYNRYTAVRMRGEKYSINYHSMKKIKKIEEVKIRNFPNKEVKKKLKMEEIFNEKQKEMTTPQRGTVIVYKKNYYYIYGEDANALLGYKLYPEEDYRKGAILIKIGPYSFYTMYEEKKINKNRRLLLVYTAFYRDIENLKRRKKKYQQHLKYKKKHQTGRVYKKYQRGIVIRNQKTWENFVILNRVEEIMTIRSLDTLEIVEYEFEKYKPFPYERVGKMDKENLKLYDENKKKNYYLK